MGTCFDDIARSLWLNYFNDYLFKQGIITAQEKEQMDIAIVSVADQAA